jgi:RNA polymerase sigma-70 factor (ECF subfamily)
MPDSELVLGIVEGRIDFAVLQRKFEHKVYGRLYRLVRNRDDAEELTQRVFIRVFEWLKSYDPTRACFCTWLYTITTSIVMSYFREKRRAPLSLDAMAESAAPSVEGPDELHELSERRARFLQTFESMDPVDRGVLIGFHVRDQAWEVVAAENGCTERHARYRAGVAMKKLRRLL